jgi:hypothetical protein
MKRRSRCSEPILAVLLAANTAAAQSGSPEPSAADLKAAQSRFEEGLSLMQSGNAADACPKFEDSLKIYRASGTLINLALCHEQVGRLASATTEFDESLARAQREHRADREETARSHLRALAPRVSHLTVSVASSADVEGLSVSMDGAELHRPSWGVRTMVDPGDHVIVANAPRRAAWTKTVTVGPNADDQSVLVDRLGAEQAPAPTASAPASTVPAVPSKQEATEGGGGRRSAGLIVGGIGLAGVAVGTVFGIVAATEWAAAGRDCPGNVCPDAQTRSKYDSVGWHADVATIGLAVGAVALAVGAYLYFTAPSARVRVGASIGPGAAGLLMGGTL